LRARLKFLGFCFIKLKRREIQEVAWTGAVRTCEGLSLRSLLKQVLDAADRYSLTDMLFTPQLRLQVNSSPNLEGRARRFRRQPSLNTKTQPWFAARSTPYQQPHVPRIVPLQGQQSPRKSLHFPLCFLLIIAPPIYIIKVLSGLLHGIIRIRLFDAGIIFIKLFF
jgi:hypothetical protein